MSAACPAARPLPGAAGECQPVPVRDSWYCERSTWPANLGAVASYPVIAVCRGCHGRIRRADIGQADWAHVPAGDG